ncbi:MAG TPA: O-antigen ligase family protein [Terriglobia bacterium]|nr:O-antigen ligase family protein [Terriglobia bacterium]
MNRALEIVLALVMAGTALAFGGVIPAAYSLMEIVLFAAVLALLVRDTWRGQLDLRVSIWPVLFAVWVGLQLVPLPAGLVRALEPARFQAPGVPGQPYEAWLTLSIYPHATLLGWTRFLAYLAAFVIAIQTFDSRKRSSLLIRALIAIGIFEAAYGSVQYLTGWEKIFTYTKEYYRGMATGTYINHNHFAGLLELSAPFLVGSILYSFQMWQANRRKGLSQTRERGAAPGFQLLVYVFLVIVILVGLIFSRSRGGILGAIISLLFIALLAQLRVKRTSWLLGLLGFMAIAGAYGAWIGLGPVLSRFEALGAGAQNFDVGTRLSFSKDALGMIRDFPWTGIGLGTFVTGVRHYQTQWTGFFVDHAHNDYVEFAAETGLVGAALLFLPIVYLLIRMVVSFLDDSRRYRPAMLLGCIGSTLAILIHSATDFNLQIPANALILAVVLGIGYKAACVERRDEASGRTSSPQALREVSGRRR